MKANFLKTSDQGVIKELKAYGYKVIKEENGMVTFLNDAKLAFDSRDKKVAYTDKLEM